MPRQTAVLVVLVAVMDLWPGALRAQSVAAMAVPEPASWGVEPTRLFLAPTARSVPRGHGSFGLTEIAFPWVEVGLLDRISVRTFVTPPLEDLTNAGIVVGPKLQLVRQSHIQAAIGVFQQLGSGWGGVGYGVVTIGGRDTLGDDRPRVRLWRCADSGGSKAVVFVGAEKAIGRRARLILEGYLGGEAFGLARAYSDGRHPTELRPLVARPRRGDPVVPRPAAEPRSRS